MRVRIRMRGRPSSAMAFDSWHCQRFKPPATSGRACRRRHKTRECPRPASRCPSHPGSAQSEKPPRHKSQRAGPAPGRARASSARASGALLPANCASRSGLMVSRSQPASAVIWPMLRKLAPMTSVAMPKLFVVVEDLASPTAHRGRWRRHGRPRPRPRRQTSCTSRRCARQRARSVAPWPGRRPPPGRTRTAASGWCGCRAAPAGSPPGCLPRWRPP